jgi:hypothetical protein
LKEGLLQQQIRNFFKKCYSATAFSALPQLTAEVHTKKVAELPFHCAQKQNSLFGKPIWAFHVTNVQSSLQKDEQGKSKNLRKLLPESC